MAEYRGGAGGARGPAKSRWPGGLCGDTGVAAPGGCARSVHWGGTSAAGSWAALALGARRLRWPGRDDHSREPAAGQHVTGTGHGRDDGFVKRQPVRLAPGAATSMTLRALVQTCYYYTDRNEATPGQHR